MSALLRRFPGGLFPRLVALFPLVFPLYLVQGVLLGVPVTLPEVLLTALFFYFLFEHDTFRWDEWKLWPVFVFFLGSVGFVFLSSFGVFAPLKSWIFSPLLFFVIGRNIFREKSSMVLLTQKALVVLAGLLSYFLFQQIDGSLGTIQALSLFVGPGLVLASLSAFYAESRWSFSAYFSVSLLAFFALLYAGAIFVLLCSLLTILFHFVLRARSRGTLPFLAFAFLFILLVCASIFYLIKYETFVFEIPEFLLGSTFLQISALLISFSVLWMSAKALLWLPEKDEPRRNFVALAFLCFLILAGFQLSFLELSHLFLFWLFMAILL